MPQVDAFSRSVKSESSLDEMRAAFEEVTDPDRSLDIPQMVRNLVRTLADQRWVGDMEMAEALSDETHDLVIEPMFKAMIGKEITTAKHRRYIRLLWNRINVGQRRNVGALLAAALNEEVPDGNWRPHLQMLGALGLTGWNSLPRSARVRLQGHIAADMLNGYHDARRRIQGQSGALGLNAAKFFHLFSDGSQVIDNIVTMLESQDWYQQNYIGANFMAFIAQAELEIEDRDRLIQAFIKARRNTPLKVENELSKLPRSWRRKIFGEDR